MIAKAAFTKIFTKYANFADVFFLNLTVKLLKYTAIYNHVIKPKDSQQLFYEPIYTLGLIELEILKVYIKINLVKGFIRPSKSSTNAFIIFN